MYSDGISRKRLDAWTFAAVVPTAIQLLSGASWLAVLLAVLLSLLCVLLRVRWGTMPASRWYGMVLWGISSLLLGVLMQESIKCWPRSGHDAVALILIILALWSALKGVEAASRVGCVLFCLFAVTYLILSAAGVKDMQIKWLKPIRTDVSGLGCVVLLTPALAAFHSDKKHPMTVKLPLIGLFCALAAIVTVGVLSPEIAANKEYAFYEMTRSLTLFGQARRFEAILSAVGTTGWFVLATLYLTICGRMAEGLNPKWGRKGIILAAAVAVVCVIFELDIPEIILLAFAAILWVLIPILTCGMGQIKKS